MKTYYFAAALLMASTAAHAGSGISFQVNGQRVHIEAPRNCESLSCIQITAPGMSGNLKSLSSKLNNRDKDDDDAPSSAPSTQANSTPPAQKTAPATPAAAPQAQVQAPAPAPAPVARDAQPAATDTSNMSAPLLHDVTPSASISVPPPVPATAATTPAPAAAVSPTAQPAAVADAPVTPLGLWATQDNKGNVQIEQCGQNLCGYAEKTREPILINMKPSDNSKWTGRIHDPEGGSNYDSTIAMKGPKLLKVQGCAFGGLFCGGQTWKRIS
jgi:uncharacterized protein (DUF2147 family)